MKTWCKHIVFSDILFIGYDYTWDEPVQHGIEARTEWFVVPSTWKICPVCGAKRPTKRKK